MALPQMELSWIGCGARIRQCFRRPTRSPPTQGTDAATRQWCGNEERTVESCPDRATGNEAKIGLVAEILTMPSISMAMPQTQRAIGRHAQQHAVILAGEPT
jgi:hypothetical protein